jgi:hypothetical protein
LNILLLSPIIINEIITISTGTLHKDVSCGSFATVVIPQDQKKIISVLLDFLSVHLSVSRKEGGGVEGELIAVYVFPRYSSPYVQYDIELLKIQVQAL